MSAGKHDDTNSTTKEEMTRVGTIIDTRSAAGEKPAPERKEETTRVGTKIDTRGAGGRAGEKSSRDLMRDGT
jgi:hypothetical protein